MERNLLHFLWIYFEYTPPTAPAASAARFACLGGRFANIFWIYFDQGGLGNTGQTTVKLILIGRLYGLLPFLDLVKINLDLVKIWSTFGCGCFGL